MIFFCYHSLYGQECLDIDFKLRGYFYAGSSIEDSNALGGFYEDRNVPKKLTSEISKLAQNNSFQLIAKTDDTVEFAEGVKGFKVFIVNKTYSIVELFAEDSRLNIKRQVFYKDKWNDIEYLPHNWCGNSYHSVFIKPNEYWDLAAPCLKGKIKAKFRFQLDTGNLTLYSNEFKGSFNKSQLEKKQGHKSTGLMDPYED